MRIIFEDVSFRYGTPGTEVLAGINMEIKAGESIGLMGATGAGKTTLLSLIIGLIQPEKGSISWYGENAGLSAQKGIKPHIAMMLQEPETQFFMPTILEELTFYYINRGLKWEEKFLKDILEKAGLPGKLMNRSPFALSGGEQRRLALAILCTQNPRLILLDEPDAGLDAQGLNILSRVLQDMKKSGIGMVISSHNSDFLDQVVDEYLVLHQGKVLFRATRDSLVERTADLRKIGLKPPTGIYLTALLKEKGLEMSGAFREAMNYACGLRGIT